METALQEIYEWANESSAYLSNASGYARGYRNGIFAAKEIVLEIIEKYQFQTITD